VQGVNGEIQTQPQVYFYMPSFLLGVAVILDPEPTPT